MRMMRNPTFAQKRSRVSPVHGVEKGSRSVHTRGQPTQLLAGYQDSSLVQHAVGNEKEISNKSRWKISLWTLATQHFRKIAHTLQRLSSCYWSPQHCSIQSSFSAQEKVLLCEETCRTNLFRWGKTYNYKIHFCSVLLGYNWYIQHNRASWPHKDKTYTFGNWQQFLWPR